MFKTLHPAPHQLHQLPNSTGLLLINFKSGKITMVISPQTLCEWFETPPFNGHVKQGFIAFSGVRICENVIIFF
jgi:hypothetical protein